MALTLQSQPINVELTRDDEGHRTYNVDWRVIRPAGDTNEYGPVGVLGVSGLPAVGSTFAIQSETDAWAFCSPTLEIRRESSDPGERSRWIVSQKFTTIPVTRCQDTTIGDPISEPASISITTVKVPKAVDKDKDGKPVRTSSHEAFRGLMAQESKFAVEIGVNQLTVSVPTLDDLLDTVNDDTMWGLPARCVLFDSVSIERLLYGTCTFYYAVKYSFAIDKKTHNFTPLDEGTKFLRAGGDKTDPDDFIAWKTAEDDRTSGLLDLNGAKEDPATPKYHNIAYHAESDLLTALPIPTSVP